MATARLSALVALCAFEEAAGHAWVTDPPARNDARGDKNGYCPQCGNGNGICGDGNQWPAGSNYVNFYNGPVATWTEGSIISVEVQVTAHHKGHYEFSVCDQVINSGLANAQACLDKHILVRASAEEAGVRDCRSGDDRAVCQPIDPRHPERYYLPPGSSRDRVYLKLPQGLTCSECTMQWRWWSANSCIPATDYACFKSELDAAGYNSGSFGLGNSCPGGGCDRCGCGEEFRNCVDVSITSNGGVPTPVTPAPTMPPFVFPTNAPVATTRPPTSPSPSPSPPSSACRAVAVNGKTYGATDEKCNKACSYIPAGTFPCESDGPCMCGAAPQPSPQPVMPSPTPSPTPTPTQATSGGGAQCGSCKGCLWTQWNACYTSWSQGVCNRYLSDGYQWCA